MDLDGVRWRKSSRSSGQDADNSNCVEVAMIDTAVWQKSSWSSGEDEDNSNCVEVAVFDTASLLTAVRDSKNPEPVLTFAQDAWSGLVQRLNR